MTSNEKANTLTKLDLSWYMLFIYLEDFKDHALCTHDKELCRLVDMLIQYVDNKLPLPNGDIEKIYVVVEQRAEE